MTELLAVDLGAEIAFWQRDKDKLLEDLRELQPTHFAAVPRVFEKIYNEATGKASGVKGKALDKAVALGLEARQKEAEGREFSFGFETKYDLADDRILSKVRDIFGGNLKFALTGAAPVSKEMLEFFYAADVLVLEGYGLTETSGVATVNTPEAFRFGTQGKPVTHCEVRIGDRAEDSGDGEADEGATDPGGEVLVRGPNVFRGYYKMEEETAEELDEDGWFHTGDVGSIDEDGFLSITGRTKDIIVTSSGKNVAAAHIENTISQQRYISHAVLFGDERNYLVALVTIDEDERSALAKEAGVDDDPETMAESPEVREKIWAAIEEANQSFAQIEQVKRFAILPRDLSQEQGELTPTLKVKRNAVYENERERFEALYEEDSG
jgi:long-chain acyl-CoA synthetase